MPRQTDRTTPPAPQRHILPGGPEIALRRSVRARRYSLRVPSTGGLPILTIPASANPEEALRFALSRRGWLLRQLRARPERVTVSHGTWLPLQGHEVEIVPGRGRAIVRSGNLLQVPGPQDRVGPRVANWLKSAAAEALHHAAGHHAARLNRHVAKLDLRDTKGRWGSCSSAGRLMFSWRLVMAPEAVLDYVAAHEAAHLREMNHSARFWDLVAQLCPDHERQRMWLRDHGATLHRYDFAAGAAAAQD